MNCDEAESVAGNLVSAEVTDSADATEGCTRKRLRGEEAMNDDDAGGVEAVGAVFGTFVLGFATAADDVVVVRTRVGVVIEGCTEPRVGVTVEREEDVDSFTFLIAETWVFEVIKSEI